MVSINGSRMAHQFLKHPITDSKVQAKTNAEENLRFKINQSMICEDEWHEFEGAH